MRGVMARGGLYGCLFVAGFGAYNVLTIPCAGITDLSRDACAAPLRAVFRRVCLPSGASAGA